MSQTSAIAHVWSARSLLAHVWSVMSYAESVEFLLLAHAENKKFVMPCAESVEFLLIHGTESEEFVMPCARSDVSLDSVTRLVRVESMKVGLSPKNNSGVRLFLARQGTH